MKFKSETLNKLSGTHSKVLVFDCEFWHVMESSGFTPIKEKPNEFFMPREIGGFVLNKSADNQWIYRNPFFVTLNPPKGKNVSFVSSAFSNVTPKTARKLDDYQSILSVPWASAYLGLVPKEQEGLILDSVELYLEDENIKDAHKPPSWLKTFLKEYSESLVIVKGQYDIIAIKNACKFYGIEYIAPKKVYDIVDWNPESHKMCGTAKLEKSFECIQKMLPTEIKEIQKILPIGEAHDPVSDSAMTFVIALFASSST